jgi:hypothetical protein
MKKQIFILVFLVVATFASVTNLYAQTCDDALHPIAGKKYTYGITVSPTGGTFNWYVATSADLMPGTSTKADNTYVIGGTGYNAPGTGTSSVDITWSSKAVKDGLAGTTKFYLVVNYAMAGCTDNLKAYAITPVNLFSILVENVDAAGATYAANNICRSPIQSATVNANGKIDYNYGSNALYLKLTANYFTTSWTPTIDIAALKASLDVTAGNQSITSIEWSLTTTFTGTSNFDLATGVATTVVPDKGADGITSGTDEFIYVKIVIAHGKFEGAADQSIALNLSAVDASGNPDVDKITGTCNDVLPANDPDKMVQIVKARPTITGTTPVVVPAAGTGVFMLPN